MNCWSIVLVNYLRDSIGSAYLSDSIVQLFLIWHWFLCCLHCKLVSIASIFLGFLFDIDFYVCMIFSFYMWLCFWYRLNWVSFVLNFMHTMCSIKSWIAKSVIFCIFLIVFRLLISLMILIRSGSMKSTQCCPWR